MKKIVFMAILAIAGLTTTQAQTKKQAPKKATKVEEKKVEGPKVEGPGMVFENETIDYGTIKKGADGNREFVVYNNGNKPLTITNTQGSCGCTVPTKPSKDINPGEKGVIGVHYDTNRVGPFTKTVTVTSNASETPKVLTIKGTVVADEPAAAPVKS